MAKVGPGHQLDLWRVGALFGSSILAQSRTLTAGIPKGFLSEVQSPYAAVIGPTEQTCPMDKTCLTAV